MGVMVMGLTPQQALLHLEKYIYYEVFYNDKRYGFCSEYDLKKNIRINLFLKNLTLIMMSYYLLHD